MTTVQDPTAPLVVVRAMDDTADPAIDWEATDAEEYRKHRNNELLVEKPGQKPVLFHIRRLPPAFVLSDIEATTSFGEKTILAVCGALYRVELPNGQPMTPKKTMKRHGVEMADNQWITDLRDEFGVPTLYEMASLAIKHASLPAKQRGPFV